MMTFIDRVPMYPGRIRLIPVPGQENTFDMIRADEPLVEGTPLNKALFDSIDTELTALRQFVSDTVFALSQRAKLEDVPIGTEIGLYENGILVPFIIVAKEYAIYGSVEGVVVVRKNCYKKDTLLDTGEYWYPNCRTDRWLNNEYISVLDGITQSVILEVPVDIGSEDGQITIDRKIFLLSSYEYTEDRDIGYYEGTYIPYFSGNDRRISMFNGEPTVHYTRTIDYDSSDNGAEYITATGSRSYTTNATTYTAGIRPAFVLPYSYEATIGVPSAENVMATAEEV